MCQVPQQCPLCPLFFLLSFSLSLSGTTIRKNLYFILRSYAFTCPNDYNIKNKELNVYAYVYIPEEGRESSRLASTGIREKVEVSCGMYTQNKLEGFLVSTPPSAFNLETSCCYTLCLSNSHEKQAVLNKCSIYRQVNSKHQIQYHERGTPKQNVVLEGRDFALFITISPVP